jgi:hypothetical protein
LYKAKEKHAWSELFLHAALYLPGEQSLPADPDGRYREMPDISGRAAGMTVARGGVVAGGMSASAPAFASASLTGPARVHNPTCEGQPRRIAPHVTRDEVGGCGQRASAVGSFLSGRVNTAGYPAFVRMIGRKEEVDGQGIPSWGHFLARSGWVCPAQNQYMFTGTDGRRRCARGAVTRPSPVTSFGSPGPIPFGSRGQWANRAAPWAIWLKRQRGRPHWRQTVTWRGDGGGWGLLSRGGIGDW